VANYVENIGKGRVIELFNRVKANEPANSAILMIPLKVSDTEANRQDDASVEAFLAATPDEQTEGWSRKVLTDSELSAVSQAADNVNNRGQASIPEVKWTAPSSGKNTTGCLLAYDSDTTGGTDANLIPLLHLDMAVTADGNDVVVNAGEVFRAT
jgi:hypothetical protein